jgi:hypothetical protein
MRAISTQSILILTTSPAPGIVNGGDGATRDG